MLSMLDPAVAWIVILLTCAITFWSARRFAMGLNWPQRKLMLYMLVIGAIFAMTVINPATHGVIIIIGLLAVIVSFFAVLTAPDQSNAD